MCQAPPRGHLPPCPVRSERNACTRVSAWVRPYSRRIVPGVRTEYLYTYWTVFSRPVRICPRTYTPAAPCALAAAACSRRGRCCKGFSSYILPDSGSVRRRQRIFCALLALHRLCTSALPATSCRMCLEGVELEHLERFNHNTIAEKAGHHVSHFEFHFINASVFKTSYMTLRMLIE